MKKSNYRLLDCGDLEKLEKVDNVVIRRPAPQALWKRKLSKEIWENYSVKYDQKLGKWENKSESELPNFKFNNFYMSLKLSSNGQIGIFPEQMVNWQWIQDIVKGTKLALNIINGFGYTGAATLSAVSPQSSITHVDAAASSVNWANNNSKLSAMKDYSIRWIVDDIMTFMNRERKRGKKYEGIILDPPAFGRSKKGGVWKIKKDLPGLINLVGDVISPNLEFIVLSCHDKDFGKIELKRLLNHLELPQNGIIEMLDLVIKSDNGNDLPAGKCARWKRC